VNSVNTCTSYERSADELKKKWSCLTSDTTRKIASNRREQRKTGGGLLPREVEITPIEDNIQAIIGNTCISGISGGIDTLEKEPSSSTKPYTSGGERPCGTLIVTEAVDNEDRSDPVLNGNIYYV
jgi:hypothetical protein